VECCQCKGIETLFNEKEARNKLDAYRKEGPAKTTRTLIDALEALSQGTEGMVLLDIGGGVGAVQHALLQAGVASATGVDASAAYAKVAQEEALRQGHGDRINYYHANFVDVAPEIPTADIVTLDRVICCYHDVQSLVGLSAAKAGRLYGVVYPRDTWWMRAGMFVSNLYLWITRNPFRGYIHPTQAVDALVHEHGLRQSFYKTTWLWQVVVYAR
jgi:hypothetical protein